MNGDARGSSHDLGANTPKGMTNKMSILTESHHARSASGRNTIRMQVKRKSQVLNNIFSNIARLMQQQTKPKFTPMYYTRRRSLSAVGEDDKESPLLRLIADDGMVFGRESQRGNDKFRKRQEKRNSTLAEEGLNVIICEVLTQPDLKEHLRNKQTLDYLDLKMTKYSTAMNKERLEKMLSLRNANKQISNLSQRSNKLRGEVKTAEKRDISLARQSDKFEDVKGSKRRLPSESYKNPPERLLTVGVGKNLANVKNATNQPKNNFERSGSVRGLREGKGVPSFSIKSVNIKKRLNEYVPIALFLAVEHKYYEMAMKIFYYDANLIGGQRPQDLQTLIGDEKFVVRLLTSVLKYNEFRVFELIIKEIVNWDTFFSEPVINVYLQQNQINYMVTFLNSFNEYLKEKNNLKRAQRRPRPSNVGHQLEEDMFVTSPTKHPGVTNADTAVVSQINKDKMAFVVKKFLQSFDNPQSNDLLLDILKNLNYSDIEITELLVLSQEEDRVTQILEQHKQFIKRLDHAKVVDLKLYKILILFDPMELINVFNMPANKEKAHSISVYHELCSSIKSSQKVQSLVFVLLNVSVTFWDFDKLWKFYQSVNEAIRFDSNSVHWLAYVNNPLLFCIKLAHFFNKMNKMLDVGSKEITTLCDDLARLCIKYIESGADDCLLLHFSDRDALGLGFFEYAFLLKKMDILEISFVENHIHNMWDMGRHSKGSFEDFSRLNILKRELKHFDMSVFKHTYQMPLEETDSFQLEYYLTSRSVYLSVVSDLVWPYSLIALEFVFSMHIIDLFLNQGEDAFDEKLNWLMQLYKESPVFSIALLTLRGSFIVTLTLRLLIFSGSSSVRNEAVSGFQVKNFTIVILLLFVIQMLGYPMFHEFWLLNNSQMLIVFTMIIYSFYLGLSFEGTGVILRIFARMIGVVVVFAIVSILVITVIAYPIHTLFIEFTQVVDGPYELNMFRSLYNGVLTLFEFVFGAVIFIRPYVEQNVYTYSMTFFMVIFSFFGNIMLANMLVAFLASQFQSITQKAKYYTLRMQYGLTKTLRLPDLDAIYSMPYFFNIIFLPVYLFMIRPGNCRKATNKLLKKFIHMINILIPWFVYYALDLAVTVIRRFILMYFTILSQGRESPLSLLHVFTWTLVGLPFLCKLYAQDLYFICDTILNLRDTDETDLFVISLNDEEREQLVRIYKKIYTVAVQLERQRKMITVSLGELIYEISRRYPLDFTVGKLRHAEAGEDAVNFPDSGNLFNQKKYQFARKFRAEGTRLYTSIIKKFIKHEDRAGAVSQATQEVDLKFLINKFKNNLTLENIDALVAFDLGTLELARRQMHSSDEDEIKAEVLNIKTKIDEITRDMSLLFKLLTKVDPKMLRAGQVQLGAGNQ